MAMADSRSKKTGVLIGGSGLIGGTLLHYFKNPEFDNVNLLAPNSKKLSIRVPEDIRSYFEQVKPDFIVNCAIASIDSDPLMAFEVNFMGAVNLARAANELGIPYIHFSSAALMPSGRDLREESRLPLSADLPNYAKGKLLTELTLEHMHRTRNLDFTCIRLAVVYGAHDHKIQGFHRLFFSIVDREMPIMLTSPASVHSYTNAKKLPAFVTHALANRGEFSGQTYNFADPEPVPLARLILAIKSMIGAKIPLEIYLPRPLAKFAISCLSRLVRMATRIGIEARLPGELLFLENFYESQTLSIEKLKRSSFVDPDPDATIYTELPELIRYYVSRWEHLNMIKQSGRLPAEPNDRGEEFLRSPETLLRSVLSEQEGAFLPQGIPRAASESFGSADRSRSG